MHTQETKLMVQHNLVQEAQVVAGMVVEIIQLILRVYVLQMEQQTLEAEVVVLQIEL